MPVTNCASVAGQLLDQVLLVSFDMRVEDLIKLQLERCVGLEAYLLDLSHIPGFELQNRAAYNLD